MTTRNKKQRLLILFSILVILNIQMFFPTNFLSSNDSTKTLEEQFDKDVLSLSDGIGEDPWWNQNFQWRQCINITNSYDDDLVDAATYIRINHTEYINQGNMQDDLDDIRIVENGVLRDYYVTTDYPHGDMATIWFEVNSSAHTIDHDTYLYYGNASISLDASYYKEDRFGLSWYSFDEDTVAGTVKDSMGKYNASLYGLGTTVAYVSGQSGSALDFEDTQKTAYIDAPYTIVDGLFDFTICFWAIEGSTGEYIISGSDGANHDYMVMQAPVETGLTWHFYVWRRNSSGTYIYEDLELDDGIFRINPGNPIDIAPGGFIIGQDQDNLGGRFSTGQAFSGALDDMRFFNYGLSNRELSWLFNDYSLDMELNTQTERAAQISVIVKDVDGRRIPGAEVSLWNGTEILDVPGIGIFTQDTDPTGTVLFSSVPLGTYNITVNYTLNSGLYEEVVYDSRIEVDGELDFTGTYFVTTIYADIWTIDFEVDDWDEDPLNYGFINVSETSSSEVLETLELDSNGLSTFRWLNRSSYYYEVYYNNTDYFKQYTLLNASTIYRQSTKTTYFVNNTNSENPSDSVYSVHKDTYLSGSEFGNPGSLKAIDASVKYINMQDTLSNTSIWYMDSEGYRSKVILKVYPGSVTEDTFLYHPNDEESYDVYGLRFEVKGENSTQCNGIIEVILTHAYTQYIKTNMSKLNIQIIDDKFFEPVEGITVKIAQNCTNGGTYTPGDTVIDLKTDENGVAHGDINDELVFLYKTGWTYNISLWIVLTRFNLFVNTSDQYNDPDALLSHYNYTLNAAYSLVLEIDLNYDDSQSRLTNGTSGSEIMPEFTWGENMTYSINFSITDDGGINWYGDNASDVSLTCTIENMQSEVIFVGAMNHLPSTVDGNYTITINSSLFSAGDEGKFYMVEITGLKTAFKPPPSNDIFPIKINPLPTGMKAYNYSSLNELTANQVSQYYGELVNITVKYYDYVTENPLTADIFTYEWDYSAGTVAIEPDPMNPGYYTFELDTSAAIMVGMYRIDITASLENHSKIENFGIFINILSRPTELNGSTDVMFVSENIYALEAQNFTFNYIDSLNSNPVSNPDEMSYTWQKLDEIGDPIPGETASGSLIETLAHSYILDLNTEMMSIGDYFIFCTFNKLNFDQRAVVMALTILDRLTMLNETSPFTPSPINIDYKEALNISFSYVDTLTSLGLTNLDNQSYTYTSNDPDDLSGLGNLVYDTNTNLYVLDFGTASRDNGTFSIIVTLDKENYTKQTCAITLIISKAQEGYHSYLTFISQNPLDLQTEVFWRDTITITFNFSTTEDDGLSIYLNNSDSVNVQFRDESLNPVGAPISLINYNTSKGVYTYTINTSEFLFIGGNSYQFEIRAGMDGYNDADPVIIPFKVLAVTTDLSIHDYTSGIEFPSYTISEYWNTTIGITLNYTESVSSAPITDAHVTFSWLYGFGQILPDATKGAGYYSFYFDTGNASEVGAYTITFLATKDNYTNGVPISNFIINIISRTTELNGSVGVTFISDSIYALTSETYLFEYFDDLTDSAIANADEITYTWQKLDEFGDPIPGETASGSLIETLAHCYILDLNTEMMTLGDYFVYVSLEKNNYDEKTAILSLTIIDRLTTLNGTSPYTPGLIGINLGEALNITFSYVDTFTSLGLTNLDNQSYTYTSNVPGDLSGLGTLVFDPNTNLYVLDFGTASKLNGTFSIIVTLDKENYTKQTCTITLIISKIQDVSQSYLTFISQNPLNLLMEVFWRDIITITFNFSTTNDGGSSIYLSNSDSISVQFRDESLNPVGAPIDLINYNTSKGVYTFTINTSEFLFIGGNTYQFEIRAGKIGYNPADPVTIPFKVLAVTTDLTIHDYASGSEFPSYTISRYWNTTFGITLYYIESVSSAPITDAYVTFYWFYGTGQVLPDATKGAGYYSFYFDTGNASEVGAYTITFLATKGNYTNGVPVSNFIVNVINRPTKLNTSETVLYISQKIYIQEAYNFTFEFIDFLTSNLIGSADEMSFILQKLDANGDPIAGEALLGTLFETINHRYILDLNTEMLADGEYSIVVTVNKDNYDFRVSIISLTITKREFTTQISRETYMEIDSGGDLQFQVTLTDPNNSSVPVIGATLYVTLQGTRYDLTENGDGTYSLSIASIADAFFIPETIPGMLTIEKANFTTSETSITVVVKMSEIFPGMPMFYFLMIVGAIVAVVGSLVGYRMIQQARIPTFVKKAREMSKNIKGRKSISDSLVYKSKEEYTSKILGEKWEMVGLSLEEILGIDTKKEKKLLESTEGKGGAE